MKNSQAKRHIRKILLAAAIITPYVTHGQILTDMNTDGGRGVVTSMENGTLDGSEYATEGIIADWSDILKDYERSNSTEDIESRMEEKSPEKNIMLQLKGKAFSVPQMIGEEGYDLFFLTTDGINFYLAIDFPCYYQVPDESIIRWIRYFAYSRRERTRKLFRRYTAWEGKIKAYFSSQGIPEELGELCLIESGCTNDPISPAGARGMWQLMPNTARQYGMTVNPYVDERSDPDLSLIVAAKMLRDCYKRTGDWTLAAAAYNCGAGNILKQLRLGRPEWNDMKQFLPKETMQYIPGLIAVHYVWTYRKELGLQ